MIISIPAKAILGALISDGGREVAIRFLRVDDTELIVSIPREALAQFVETALAERDRPPN